jgi:hypothetical protein
MTDNEGSFDAFPKDPGKYGQARELLWRMMDLSPRQRSAAIELLSRYYEDHPESDFFRVDTAEEMDWLATGKGLRTLENQGFFTQHNLGGALFIINQPGDHSLALAATHWTTVNLATSQGIQSEWLVPTDDPKVAEMPFEIVHEADFMAHGGDMEALIADLLKVPGVRKNRIFVRSDKQLQVIFPDQDIDLRTEAQWRLRVPIHVPFDVSESSQTSPLAAGWELYALFSRAEAAHEIRGMLAQQAGED